MQKKGLKLWSTNTGSYYNEAVKLYNEGIFDYIELYVVPNTTDAIKNWKKLNIPFIIHCPHFAHGFNLAKRETKNSNIEIYKQVRDFADELNAAFIIFHGGIDGDIKETAQQLASFNERRALIENKPYIALPNKMGGNFCRGYNTDEIKTVMKTSNCGFCLDFGHAVCAANSLDKEIYTFIEDFMKLSPVMFHLTDIKDVTSPYDTHIHLGEGELNLLRIVKMIPDGACITFETIKNNTENLDDFVEDMQWLKNLK